ncbi:MAG TPA: carboxymuconolactone decarboxylase family protein [Ohtaekwangia sp.]|uniref:carboxymuconolactone decarboxylase family protein n=1 Tax=Ohtaekwangia sp. TaxID=2066019 RepID=UPI002F9338FA
MHSFNSPVLLICRSHMIANESNPSDDGTYLFYYTMKNYKVPAREEVSPANQTLFDKLQQALGMVPNLYATIAYSENGLGKYLAFQQAKSSLSNKEKEAVNLVVSQVNGCRYCQSAHTVLGKMNGFSDAEVIDLRKGNSSQAKLQALVALAKEITEKKGHASSVVLDAFYAAGYTDGTLVDLILQISDKIAMNYLHNLTQVPIDFPVAQEL